MSLEKLANETKKVAVHTVWTDGHPLMLSQHKMLANMAEEVGEVSKDLRKGNIPHAQLECIDVVVAALGTFYALGGSDETLRARWDRSNNKWKKNIGYEG
jgi:hypothetical protein